jgi:hypothetical protein
MDKLVDLIQLLVSKGFGVKDVVLLVQTVGNVWFLKMLISRRG